MTVSTQSADEADRQKHAPVIDGVLPVILERWSPRSFKSREVDPEDLKRVFEAARWAPSSFNEQPWRFIVAKRESETFNKIVATMTTGNQAWAPKAPVLILGIAKKDSSQNGNPNRFAIHDLGAAMVLITLEARALGLATHQMAGFDQGAAQKALGIPDEFAIGSIMALGYQGEPSALPNENLIARELAPRTRKPLNELVFSQWDEPTKLG
jgi:nitroreductase